ncbi:MAG: AtpZ/AtpI family protein [Christensenellales bacterium]
MKNERRGNGKDRKARSELMRAITAFSQIGVTIVACVLVGVFLGRWLDNLLGTSPWLLLVFSLFGAGAALKALFDMGKR